MRALLKFSAIAVAGLAATSFVLRPEVRISHAVEVFSKEASKLWHEAHPASFAWAQDLFRTHLEGIDLTPAFAWYHARPEWLVLGLLALVLAAGAWGPSFRRQRHQDDRDEPRGTIADRAARTPRSDLRAALSECRIALTGVALFSAVCNMLMLTGAIYMLEIYDRVLASRSIPTLIAISVVAGVLFLAQGAIELIRGRLLARIGAQLDQLVAARVFGTLIDGSLKSGRGSEGLEPLRDLESIRGFLSGAGPTALFDLPWIPFYLVIIFAFHPLLGMTALLGALALVGLTIVTEALTRQPTRAAAMANATRAGLADAARRNAESITAMGMRGALARLWQNANEAAVDRQRCVSDVSGGIGAFARSLRMMLQSAMLGIGAYLVIQQEATGGIIIAGSILSARALAPADLAIANWKGFVAARQSWQRLDRLLKLLPADTAPLPLPPPINSLSVESVSVAPPGLTRLVVHDASFNLISGQGLGIIGPSASGKSTLARVLVGVWAPTRGRVRLDGAALDQWTPDTLGRHVGYLAQNVELFAGTVAQNIARFDPSAGADEIMAAARAARVHDLITALPQGYATEIGEHGARLSAGQQQRIALARALYGTPFLVVLDEPNANLDAEGEAALTQAILATRQRGGIVVVIAHRPSAIAGIDHVLVMNKGCVQAFGPKDEILSKMARPPPVPTALRMVADTDQGRA